MCLNHIEQLCSKCSYEQFTLVYRYTLDEMKIMKTSLTKHIEEYKGWEGKVESAIKCMFNLVVNNSHAIYMQQ